MCDADEATSVNKDTANIKVGDIYANDQQVIMGKNDTPHLILTEGNRLPASLGHLQHASMSRTENIMCIRRPNVVLLQVIGCASQSRIVDGRDDVDLALVKV